MTAALLQAVLGRLLAVSTTATTGGLAATNHAPWWAPCVVAAVATFAGPVASTWAQICAGAGAGGYLAARATILNKWNVPDPAANPYPPPVAPVIPLSHEMTSPSAHHSAPPETDAA